MDSPGIAPGSPTCDAGIFLLDDEPIRVERKQTNADHAAHGARSVPGLKLTSDYVATCFQDRLLIQPGDFRS